MCWYCDTVTGDWLVDYHPDYANLFVATGCSGHAFKFAPNLGREVLALIERRPTQFTDRFSFAPTNPHGADYRGGVMREINLAELAGPTDLLPFGRPARL
jgi:sarcosine oxidase/L-pipecolate oxidase